MIFTTIQRITRRRVFTQCVGFIGTRPFYSYPSIRQTVRKYSKMPTYDIEEKGSPNTLDYKLYISKSIVMKSYNNKNVCTHVIYRFYVFFRSTRIAFFFFLRSRFIFDSVMSKGRYECDLRMNHDNLLDCSLYKIYIYLD